MKLIDIYVTEVGRHLPAKTHQDIEAEIRSILEDMLEEHSQKTGKPVDDEMVFSILKEYGSPTKIAASYMPERYLIGPSLFPIFTIFAKVVLWITGLVAIIGLGISLGTSAANIQGGLDLIGKTFVNFYNSAMISFASIVITFAIIEWAIYQSGNKLDIMGLPKILEWDPHSLVKIIPGNRVKRGDTIAEVVFTFLAILLFNFYPQVFTLGFSSTGNWYVGMGNWTSVPFLSEAFFRYVPFLTLVWVMTVILDIFLLQQGYWSTITRLVSIGIKTCEVSIAAAMLAGPSLIALTVASFPPNANPTTVHGILTIAPQVVLVALWLTIVVGSFEVIGRLVRLILNRNYISKENVEAVLNTKR